MSEDEATRAPGPSGTTSPSAGGAGSSQETSSAGGAAPEMHAYIGRQLRAVYDDIAQQPVPERFLTLMRKLEGSSVED